jgi:3-methylfumaryl-CoA hydratase
MSTLDPAAIAHWQTWVGREEQRRETIDVEVMRRYASAVGEDLDVERRLPALAHWAYFLPVVAGDGLGPDGHPKRGGFLPPVTLPRRMFAASTMEFGAPLLPGLVATMTSTVADVRHRNGRSGDLILVDVDRVIEQSGSVCVRERQSIVYRDAGEATPAVTELPAAPGTDDVVWRPGPVELFRFSAATYNSHRIHYDRPYATTEEGYPDLVVHGPYTAAKLYALARDRIDATPARFAFRGLAPLFVSQTVRLTAGEVPGEYQAIRCDETVAMTATVETPSARS